MPQAGKRRYKIRERIICYRVCASGTERRVSCRQFLALLPLSTLTTIRETQVRPTSPSQYCLFDLRTTVAQSLQCATPPLPKKRRCACHVLGSSLYFPHLEQWWKPTAGSAAIGGFAKEADLTRPPQSSSRSFLQCRPFLQSAFSSERRRERA